VEWDPTEAVIQLSATEPGTDIDPRPAGLKKTNHTWIPFARPVWPTLVCPEPLAVAKPWDSHSLQRSHRSRFQPGPAFMDKSCCVPSAEVYRSLDCLSPPNATFALPGTTLIPLSVPRPRLRPR